LPSSSSDGPPFDLPQREATWETTQSRRDTRDQRQGEEGHRMFVEQPDSDQRPEGQPQCRMGPAPQAHRHIRGSHPEEGLEAVHGQHAGEGGEYRRDQRGHRRRHLRRAPAAELPGHPSGEEDQQGASEGRKEADGEERIAESPAPERGDRRDQRRVIDIAPRQVLAAGDEVQLVDPVAVAPAEGEMERQDGEGDRPESRGIGSRGGCGRHAALLARVTPSEQFWSAAACRRFGVGAGAG
jgi:hypothetical protein